MGIEQDIQQVKFRNEYQKAFINILYTHGWLSEKAKEFFADEDITPQQFNIPQDTAWKSPSAIVHFTDPGEDAG
ncbi:MAG: hypothetical protein WDO71_02905 [Bacteroidota bacterium]